MIKDIKIDKTKIREMSERFKLGIETEEDIKNLKDFRLYHYNALHVWRSTLITKFKKHRIENLMYQRIKRTPSIKLKLEKMDLTIDKMQDIAGIRIVVDNIDNVYSIGSIIRSMENSLNFQSQFKKENDYIKKMKDSGYRSYHIIYNWNYKKEQNKQCFIEIQVRTKVQHSWATAVEVLGFYKKQHLKQGVGDKEIRNILVDLSKCFELIEKKEINQKLFKKTIDSIKKSKIIDKLKAFTIASNQIHDDIKNNKKQKIFLIKIDFKNKWVSRKGFNKEELAINEYVNLEKLKDENIDVVLVSIEDIKYLKEAYPNYFLDTKDFISNIENLNNLNI